MPGAEPSPLPPPSVSIIATASIGTPKREASAAVALPIRSPIRSPLEEHRRECLLLFAWFLTSHNRISPWTWVTADVTSPRSHPERQRATSLIAFVASSSRRSAVMGAQVNADSNFCACQFLPPVLPVWHHAPQHPPVGRTVVRDPQVDELVRNHIVETPGRQLDHVGIERDPLGRR